jgi:hypothetical protein
MAKNRNNDFYISLKKTPFRLLFTSECSFIARHPPLCFENYKLITDSHMNVTVCYSPAHKVYHGNELADDEQKMVCQQPFYIHIACKS